MDLGIANNSIFPNLLTPCLKLGLNQSHNLTLICQDSVQGRKNQTEGNETHINTGKARFLLEISLFSIAEIELLHADNSWVLA